MAHTTDLNTSTNGNTTSNVDVSTIVQALQIVHNPASDNAQRREASAYLENIKYRDDAVEIGSALGEDTTRESLVRHFGLSLLEHVIRHQGHDLNAQSNERLRQRVINLAETIQNTPQAFLRNKIAGIWVELAKRSWALDWYDLDRYLVSLWSQGSVCKEFVLSVLENLSEDVFVREDAIAILRDRDLNNAVVEIFTSPQNYQGGLKVGDTTYHMRHGDEGWTSRITQLLNECLQHEAMSRDQKRTCIAALATLRSTFLWIMTPAIAKANCLIAVCNCLTKEDADIIMGAIDALLALYGRQKLEELDIQALVYPLCSADSIAGLSRVYEWSIVSPDDILDSRYAISKKLAELIYHLATWCVQYPPPPEVDFSQFLLFLVSVAQHDSLIVSIAALHAWERILMSSTWRKLPSVQACLQQVLQFAMGRIVAFDQLPEDTDEPAVLFVNEEIELFPERQGFYLNYRKFCHSIIDWICYTFLDDALNHILAEVDAALDQVAQQDALLNLSEYKRLSGNALRADAQFTAVEAAFRGIDRWRRHQETQSDEAIKLRLNGLLAHMMSWSTDMLANRPFRDPFIRQRQIKTAVEVSSKMLNSDTEFAFTVLQYILSSFLPLDPNYPTYSDTMGELHSYASTELRKLALEHATYFVTFYDQLESKFAEITGGTNVDRKVQIDLKSSLFLIVEHAAGIGRSLRQERLQTFLEPLAAAWNAQTSSLSDFETFIQQSGFDQVAPYLAKINATSSSDWTEVSFGQDAVEIQTRMTALPNRIPLRETRVLLSVSTDRLEVDSETYEIVSQLWIPLLPTIISNVLRIASYCHKLHDPLVWPNVPPNMHNAIARVLRDRYWQSGISGGSMNEFHAKVKATKSTLEGFASSVRGKIRIHLENCYSIVHTLGRLGSQFYGLPEVPEMIAEGLIDTTPPLGTHHFGTLLSMLPKLIEECPSQNRQGFLTPILSALLRQMDSRCSNDWQKVHDRGETDQQGELNDEMREESVLRQTTYRAVNMVASWLDPQRELQQTAKRKIINRQDNALASVGKQSLRDFVLSNLVVLEPLLVFCTHAIAYRDTKACATMVTALQKFIPIFATETYLQGSDAAAVREYASSEMLKTAISSLNDGYFADYQGQLASLIAIIWLSYGLPAHVPASDGQAAYERPAWTQTPRNVLLSISGLSASKVDEVGAKLASYGLSGPNKKMRALILQLLEGVRGIRISEMGKFDTKQAKSSLVEKYKQREALGMQGVEEQNMKQNGNADTGADLDGIASMFG